jgi:5-methylcytosine-specific restriction endonuclease McrA
MKTTFSICVFSLCCAMLLLWGCKDEGQPNENPRSRDDGTGENRPIPDPLLEGWEEPQFALLLSGQQHGYLEPCGCSEFQSGGLARRYDLLKKMEAKGWTVAGLDVGGLLKRSGLQAQIKFDAFLRALKEMHYLALNLGPEELALDATTLLGKGLAAEERSMPFMSANVVMFDSPDVGMVRSRVVDVNGHKIGVTSVVDPELLEHNPGVQDGTITVTPPAEALKPVVEQLESEQPDVMILLAHAEEELCRKLAKAYPQFQLILCGGGFEDPDGQAKFEGDAMLLHVGKKGKYTGVVGYYPDAEKPFRFELVKLDAYRFEHSPEMTEVMREYQDRLKNENVIEREPTIRHLSGYEFVGEQDCKECHKKAHAKWSETRHAHAYESLIKGREDFQGEWISRIHDPECLVCHTTGWSQQHYTRYESGFLSEEATPHLLGNQCENCHGPSSRHSELEWKAQEDRKSVEFETLVAERGKLQLKKSEAAKNLCTRCHDGDNSPNFDFEKYWPKVEHIGRD